MTVVLYAGSGPGAPEATLFQRSNGSTRALEPHHLVFPGRARDVDRLAGVLIGSRSARIVLGPLGGPVETALEAERCALYHPLPSPDGGRLAWLETPDAFYPPRRGGSALLRLAERRAGAWQPLPHRIPALLAPVDWGADDQALILTRPDGVLAQVQLGPDGVRREDVLARDGTAPRMRADGGALAWIAQGGLEWRAGAADGPMSGGQIPIADEVLALAWEGEALLTAVASGFWNTELRRIDPATRQTTVLFAVPEITWIG